MTVPYNPLAMANLGHSIMTAIEETTAHPLGDLPSFQGAGVYAIYYDGGHPAYSALSHFNSASPLLPIYVGKAVPDGARKGLAETAGASSRRLYDRLREHASSVRAASNLDIADFKARYLVVEDIWIPLGESALIRKYAPVWNVRADGFGNHAPGSGRAKGARSVWDTLHPGRFWAAELPDRPESQMELQGIVAAHLEKVIRTSGESVPVDLTIVDKLVVELDDKASTDQGAGA